MIKTVYVSFEDNGKRLDAFLSSALEDVTRNQVQTWLDKGAVSLNGQSVSKASLKVHEDQVYIIEIPEPVEALPLPVEMPLDICYEDADILVLNKPAGLVVHPGAGHYQDTLVNGLLYHCKDLSGIGGVLRPGIVHRLDKDTSGLMVVAKHDKAHNGLSLQFQEKGREDGIIRQYIGFCWGTLYPKYGRVETYIARDHHDRQRMTNVKGDAGKLAITDYEVIEAYGNDFLKMLFTLMTGRTHQIRVHCQHIKCLLLGDPIYGARKTPSRQKNIPKDILNFPRQALHAAVLEFFHPITQKRLSFNAPLPSDLELLEKNLNNLYGPYAK